MKTEALPPALPLIAPTDAEWQRMSPDAREAFLVRILDTLSDPAEAMSEGRRHKKAKTRALDALGVHFRSIGRDVYLAEEMAVVYPGAAVFSPDLLAVLDVAEPDDDARLAWVVADEGKGLDLVIEVLHHGNRTKDLVANVERYASLGIPEYFVYDRLNQKVVGYRLPDARARRYQRIVPQLGRHHSSVLGLSLAIVDDRLRFFSGEAELPGTGDLIGRLSSLIAGLEAKAEAVETELQAEQAETARVRSALQAEQTETARARLALQEGIVAFLGARGIPCSDEVKERLSSCADSATLQRWLLRATSVHAAEELFSG
ncbi:MAG: Uma2 family endonuclease [Minicystis sp.]